MHETFDHTADLGLRVMAADLDTLFVEAARGLFSIIVANLDHVQPVRTVEVRLAGEARDYLLFDWLSELLFVFETQRLVLADFAVHVGDNGLTATARGEPLDPARHVLANEVKAVTYHGLTLDRTPAGWQADLILDI